MEGGATGGGVMDSMGFGLLMLALWLVLLVFIFRFIRALSRKGLDLREEEDRRRARQRGDRDAE